MEETHRPEMHLAVISTLAVRCVGEKLQLLGSCKLQQQPNT